MTGRRYTRYNLPDEDEPDEPTAAPPYRMTEYAEGRAEGFAMVLAGMSSQANSLTRRTDTVKAIAAHLHANGGGALVLDIADAYRAIEASKAAHPSNGEAVPS